MVTQRQGVTMPPDTRPPRLIETGMIPVDYHLHSTFSADGEAAVLEMCEAALAHGLREVCFTEHVDFDRSDPAYGHLDWAAYTASVAEARRRCAGRLVIRQGVEFDFRRAYGAEPGEFLAALDLDFAIGSVHSAAGCRIHRLWKDRPPGLDLRTLLAEYFAETEALVASGWCQTIGHFDYIYKQLPDLAAGYRDAWYWRSVERILRACIAGGVAVELNTHHVLDRGAAMAADVEILRYRALGGRLIAVGSDAHRPGDVAHAFPEAERDLREAGFDAVTGYACGRPYDVALT
jgi:histidinol-phosphatase (PHP family)